MADPITARHFDTIGVDEGWHCLEVGAGGGSIARWLARRVGPTGTVVATDVDTRHLAELPSNVEVRRHDLTAEAFDTGAYDLVHVRALLEHLSDPATALSRIAAAMSPGGYLLVEGNDLGLFTMSGSPDAARGTAVLHDVLVRWAAAGVLDGYYARQIPGDVDALHLEVFGFDSVTVIGLPGQPAYETIRLAWPALRQGAAAVGISEDNLLDIDRAIDASSTLMVAMTLFAAWGRKPH